jgi:hypothetical protein
MVIINYVGTPYEMDFAKAYSTSLEQVATQLTIFGTYLWGHINMSLNWHSHLVKTNLGPLELLDSHIIVDWGVISMTHQVGNWVDLKLVLLFTSLKRVYKMNNIHSHFIEIMEFKFAPTPPNLSLFIVLFI